MATEVSQTAEISFKDVPYTVSANSNGESLVIDVEDKDNGDRWQGTFNTAYIESLTHKTGNFKSFRIFVKMLCTALTGTSDGVYLELLTYRDLELMKNGTNTNNPNPSLAKKRYLILTYMAEFDKVHYPLPLVYVEDQDPQGTILRLRKELNSMKRAGGGGGGGGGDASRAELDSLRQRNRELTREVEKLQDDLYQYQNGEGAAGNEIELRRRIADLEAELETEQANGSRAAARHKQEMRAAQEREEVLKRDVTALKVELGVIDRRRGVSGVGAARRSVSSQRRKQPAARSVSARDNARSRSRSPGQGRFDPTAYVREKERKTKESKAQMKRPSSAGSSGSSASFDRRQGPIDAYSARSTSSRRSRPPPQLNASPASIASYRSNTSRRSDRSNQSIKSTGSHRSDRSGGSRHSRDASRDGRHVSYAEGSRSRPVSAGSSRASARQQLIVSESADIGERLDALQGFLKGARRTRAT